MVLSPAATSSPAGPTTEDPCPHRKTTQRPQTHKQTHSHAHTTHTNIYIYMYIHTYVHTYIHTLLFSYCVRVYELVCLYVNLYIYIYIIYIHICDSCTSHKHFFSTARWRQPRARKCNLSQRCNEFRKLEATESSLDAMGSLTISMRIWRTSYGNYSGPYMMSSSEMSSEFATSSSSPAPPLPSCSSRLPNAPG